MAGRTLQRVVVFLGLAALPSAAWAGGFDTGENGPRAMGRAGAYAASVDEPSALYYNPAGLTRSRGLAATVNLNLIRADVEFQRDPYVITPGVSPELPIYREVQFAPVENEAGFYPAPMLFMSHDFGLENWTFAAGVYGPSAVGRMSFPEMSTAVPTAESDRARDGGQSYSIVSADLLLFYPSLAAAYRFDALNLSVGLTLQAALLDVNYRVGADGLNGPGSANSRSTETPQLYSPNELAVRGATGTGILGVMWDPTPNLSFGASYRPRFKIKARGDISVEFPEELVPQGPFINDTGAQLTTRLPDVVRLGAVYRSLDADGNENWDVEANVVYEGWSINEGFQVELDGRLETATEAINPQALPDLFLGRYYQDTVSVRVGSDLSMLRNENGNGPVFRLGGSWESNGTPNEWTNLDFMPFMRITGTAGMSYHFGSFAVDVAGGYVFSPERTVENGQYELLAPLWVCANPVTSERPEACNEPGLDPTHAVNSGTYKVGFPMMSFGLTYGW